MTVGELRQRLDELAQLYPALDTLPVTVAEAADDVDVRRDDLGLTLTVAASGPYEEDDLLPFDADDPAPQWLPDPEAVVGSAPYRPIQCPGCPPPTIRLVVSRHA